MGTTLTADPDRIGPVSAPSSIFLIGSRTSPHQPTGTTASADTTTAAHRHGGEIAVRRSDTEGTGEVGAWRLQRLVAADRIHLGPPAGAVHVIECGELVDDVRQVGKLVVYVARVEAAFVPDLDVAPMRHP